MQELLVLHDRIHIHMLACENLARDPAAGKLFEPQCTLHDMTDQRVVIGAAFGMPEACRFVLPIQKIERIQQMVVRDGRDVADRELDAHIDIIGRIDQRLVFQALVVDVVGIHRERHLPKGTALMITGRATTASIRGYFTF